MKRILIFSLAYIPHVGGAEIAIKEITDRIGDSEFHLLTLNFGGEVKEEKIGNVLVHRIGNSDSYISKILFIPRAAFAARRLHRKHQFNALWAMMSYMLFPIVLLRIAGLRVPYLLTLQEGDPWEHMFSRWFIIPFRPLLRAGFKHASAVQAISTYLAKWATRMGYQGNTKVIPNGYIDPQRHTDIEWFSEADDVMNKKVFWRNHGGKGIGPVLITTSRLVHKNAVDVIIRALDFLPKTIWLAILGKGPEREELGRLVSKIGVNDRVLFAGEISNTSVLHYLRASDIFVRPSRSEGMGNSFIEAMAAGLPVVATQEGGIADFLFDAKRNPDKEPTGWAVDRDAPEQIAQAVKDILANPEQAERVTANAKRLALEKYDWNRIAEQMRTVFGRVGNQ